MLKGSFTGDCEFGHNGMYFAEKVIPFSCFVVPIMQARQGRGCALMYAPPMLLEIMACNLAGYQISWTQRGRSSKHSDEFVGDVGYTQRGLIGPSKDLMGGVSDSQKSQFTAKRLNHWRHAFHQMELHKAHIHCVVFHIGL